MFFCTQCGAVNAGGALRLLKSQCDGSGESRQKARRKLERGLMLNEHVMADAKRALWCALFFLDVAGRFYRASSMSLVTKKTKQKYSLSDFPVSKKLINLLDNEQECELSAKLVSIYARRFSPGRCSFLGPGSEKKWHSTHESKPQGEWNRVAELMMIKFSESGHPVFRSTSPLSRGTLRSKGGQLSIHFFADEGTIETVFRTIISVNQLSIYGAVTGLCEEYTSCHVRTGRPVLV